MFKFNKIDEIKKVFIQNRTHDRALLVDLDGTLIEFEEGKRKHKVPKLRPHFDTFVNQLSNHVDLFVFSASNPIRLKNIAGKYLGDKFKGFFDRRYMSRKRKCLNVFKQLDSTVLLIDDNPQLVHSSSQQDVIRISTWKGDPNDDELLKVLEVICQRLDLKL